MRRLLTPVATIAFLALILVVASCQPSAEPLTAQQPAPALGPILLLETPPPAVSPTPKAIPATALAPTLTPPDQNIIGLSADELFEKLFDIRNPLQQESLWEDYKDKQVEWTGTLRDKTIREDMSAALFEPNVVVILDEMERQTLSLLDIGDLVTYRGSMAIYETNMVEILYDHGLSVPLISIMLEDLKMGLTWSETLKNHGFDLSEIMEVSDIEFQEIIHLTDGVIISYK